MPQTTHALEKQITKRVRLNYLLHVPDSASENPAQKWPLILFLHGAGERGDDPDMVRAHGLPKILDTQPDFPFIVVSPQCPANTHWGHHLDALMALLDEVQTTYPVDADRVYLTGLSMGGMGTWALAAAYPDRFAAIAPVCGSRAWFIGDPAQICVLKDVPVWAFHGALDLIVPLADAVPLVVALRDCGGDVRLTVYEDVGHDSWNRAYATPELYDWFLSHRLRDASRRLLLD
ncbi:MAG: prolyl oligopeptidase family serine peptidase [Chloroflexota bacterium]|nr:MAG: phospholipase [Chloroflexota bacterium]